MLGLPVHWDSTLPVNDVSDLKFQTSKNVYSKLRHRLALPQRVSVIHFPDAALPQAGANMIVSGSAVIGSDDPRSVIALLRTVVADAIQKRSLDR